jgi:hypothetical protein
VTSPRKPVQILCEGRDERKAVYHVVLHRTLTRYMQSKAAGPPTHAARLHPMPLWEWSKRT